MGIEVDSKRRRICWQTRGGRNFTEVQVKVFDLASPIAAQTNFDAGADRPAHLCRMADEAGADRVDAGGDKGDVNWDVDGHLSRVVIVVDIADDALRDAVRDALSDSEARTANGARSLDPADGETPRGIDQ